MLGVGLTAQTVTQFRVLLETGGETEANAREASPLVMLRKTDPECLLYMSSSIYTAKQLS